MKIYYRNLRKMLQEHPYPRLPELNAQKRSLFFLLAVGCSYAKATQDDPIKLPNFSAQNDVLNTNKFNVEDKETSTSSSSTKKGNKIRFRKSPKNTTLLRYSF